MRRLLCSLAFIALPLMAARETGSVPVPTAQTAQLRTIIESWIQGQKLPDGSGLEKVVNPKQFTLRKTLVPEYTLPGTRATRMYAKPQRQPHHWTMR